MPDFFSERISKARKETKCCECGKKIQKGQKYWYCAGKWDGEMSYYRQHIECRDACYAIQKHIQDCIPFGGLWEYLSEYGTTWDENTDTLREKCDHEKKIRRLYAEGHWASRTKDLNKYNLKHEGRKP